MQKIIVLFVFIILSGCAGTRFSKEPPSQISISRTVKLNTAPVWPLKIKGTYLQKVTATAWGKQQSFSVYLTLDNEMLEAIAFNDVAGRLYRLKWTPQNVIWEGSDYIPSMIKPDNILIDFLLAHLPIQQLNSVLKGARVFEKGNLACKTRQIKNKKILRTIVYSQPMGYMWGHVVIENPVIGYKLVIQTVEQS